MAYIWSVATALPPHVITAADLVALGRQLFADVLGGGVAAFERLVANTRVARRYLVRPPEELLGPRRLEETSRWYHEATRSLGRAALDAALARAGVAASEVDAIVVCSSTGFMVPSLDSYLINELGMRRTTRRLPYATLGCAGGVGGVIRGAEAIAARGPDATVALVTVETPTITFRPGDRSMANVVASTLFGDGAAAVVLRGRPPSRRRSLRVRAARSWLFPESYDAMGFALGDDGFRVILSPEVPDLVATGLRDECAALARAANATPSDVRFHVLHPGGTRVLERIEQALALPPDATRVAWDVLRDHGNMSSSTVLFVLEETLRRGWPPVGALGVMCAFGPGFAAEAALLERTEAP